MSTLETGVGVFGIITGIIAVATAVVEVVKRISDCFSDEPSTRELCMADNGYESSDSYQCEPCRRFVKPQRSRKFIEYNYGGYDMNKYDNDPYGINLDAPNGGYFGSELPYGYGYDVNKPDSVWTNKTLGQVPSMSNYVYPNDRRTFDPSGYLRNFTGDDVYYGYGHTNYFEPRFADNVRIPSQGPLDGIVYSLDYTSPRTQYNPYEPARPFTTYDPMSINACNPVANPFGLDQNDITGIVNRSNYYSDYLVNSASKGIHFAAPDGSDNPWKQIGGHTVCGPDGNYYTANDPYTNPHTRTKFINFNDELSGLVPTLGAEEFGNNPYGININGSVGYYNKLLNNNGGYTMNESRRDTYETGYNGYNGYSDYNRNGYGYGSGYSGYQGQQPYGYGQPTYDYGIHVRKENPYEMFGSPCGNYNMLSMRQQPQQFVDPYQQPYCDTYQQPYQNQNAFVPAESPSIFSSYENSEYGKGNGGGCYIPANKSMFVANGVFEQPGYENNMRNNGYGNSNVPRVFVENGNNPYGYYQQTPMGQAPMGQAPMGQVPQNPYNQPQQPYVNDIGSGRPIGGESGGYRGSEMSIFGEPVGEYDTKSSDLNFSFENIFNSTKSSETDTDKSSNDNKEIIKDVFGVSVSQI